MSMIDLLDSKRALSWTIEDIAAEIETEFRAHLKTETLHYCYYDCPVHAPEGQKCGPHARVWRGAGLVPFFEHLMTLRGHWASPLVTSAPSEDLVMDMDDVWDTVKKDDWDYERLNSYWIGDLGRVNEWQCADPMILLLWHRMKDRGGDPDDYVVEGPLFGHPIVLPKLPE